MNYIMGFLGVLFMILIKDWLFTKLIRFIISKTNLAKASTLTITYLLTILVILSYLFIIKSFSVIQLILELIVLTGLLLIDNARWSKESRIIKFLHNRYMRWNIAVLTFPFILVMIIGLWDALFPNITYTIPSLILTILIFYIIVRKQRETLI